MRPRHEPASPHPSGKRPLVRAPCLAHSHAAAHLFLALLLEASLTLVGLLDQRITAEHAGCPAMTVHMTGVACFDRVLATKMLDAAKKICLKL